jgi:hypothetical protein
MCLLSEYVFVHVNRAAPLEQGLLWWEPNQQEQHTWECARREGALHLAVLLGQNSVSTQQSAFPEPFQGFVLEGSW